MILVDKTIKKLAENQELLNPFYESNLNSMSYDLTVSKILLPKQRESKNNYKLNPRESIFIESEEIVNICKNLVGRITLKNSRIRQGLTIEAPLYQPGHKTRVYIRVTNLSANQIHIKKGDLIASILFEELESDPINLYNGTFQDEFDFTGLADYTGIYDELEVEEKIDSIKNIERSIYANVIMIVTIFVGIFSLINFNFNLIRDNVLDARNLIVYNLISITTFYFLSLLISIVIPREKKYEIKTIVGIVAVIILILIALIIIA